MKKKFREIVVKGVTYGWTIANYKVVKIWLNKKVIHEKDGYDIESIKPSVIRNIILEMLGEPIEKPLIWGTWDGRNIPFEDLTHQHLTNIYYFMTLISPKVYEESFVEMVLDTIKLKYGDLLGYHPDPFFHGELLTLMKLGYLKPNGDIIVDGKLIGEVVYDENL